MLKNWIVARVLSIDSDRYEGNSITAFFKKDKENPLWKNFCAHLEEYGIDIEKL